MSGHGFNYIGDDCFGWLATDNNVPLEFYGRDVNRYQFDIEVVSDSELRVLYKETYGYGVFYCGAIGNGINAPLWVNNTKPI